MLSCVSCISKINIYVKCTVRADSLGAELMSKSGPNWTLTVIKGGVGGVWRAWGTRLRCFYFYTTVPPGTCWLTCSFSVLQMRAILMNKQLLQIAKVLNVSWGGEKHFIISASLFLSSIATDCDALTDQCLSCSCLAFPLHLQASASCKGVTLP